MQETIIHIWRNHHCVFIDIRNTSNNDSYEIKRFPLREYNQEKLPSEISYHVNRIHQITGFKWKDDAGFGL